MKIKVLQPQSDFFDWRWEGRKELLADGIVVTALGLNKRNILLVFYQLFKLIKSDPPQIIQTWMYHADLIGGLTARLAGCKSSMEYNTEVPQRKFW